MQVEPRMPKSRIGSLAVLAVAGYAAYRYRFQIQSFLEEYGIKTPWLKGDAVEAVRSGAAKFEGNVRRELSGRSNSATI